MMLFRNIKMKIIKNVLIHNVFEMIKTSSESKSLKYTHTHTRVYIHIYQTKSIQKQGKCFSIIKFEDINKNAVSSVYGH